MAVIYNVSSNTIITGTAMSDSILNGVDVVISSVTIDAGAGNDTITNRGKKVSINGGAGNDNIFNAEYASVTAIDGGAGNDSISISGNDVSIWGGTGNDTISIKNNKVVGIFYSDGDGNDIIKGYNSSSMIQIGDGTDTYSTIKSGSDLIIIVGDGSINVKGAADMDVYINGVESELPIWRLNGTTATYGTSSNTQITITGVKSLDGISLSGKTVTIANSALNQGTVTINSGYTLALSDDVTRSTTTAGSWGLSGNTATYTTPSTTTGYTLANNQINYVTAGGGDTVTVSGVKSTSGLSVDGTTITVANAALNQGTVTVSNGYTLALASDVATPATTAGNWSLSGTTATYTTAYTSAGYRLANNQITYAAASGGDKVTVSGVKSINFSISGNVITVAAAALNGSNVTISDSNYTLQLASDVTAPVTDEATWTQNGTMATYKGGATTAGYSVANNEIIYTPSSNGSTFLISGVTSTDGITVNGNVVTLPASALGQSPVIINDNNFTLTLASDVATPITVPAYWTLNGTTATYTNALTTAGYAVNNNQVIYTDASGGEKFNVTGVKSTNGLSLNGNIVTVAANALNQDTVTISDNNYTLALANDVTEPVTTAASWSLSGNIATYTNAATTAGYTLENNQISYTPASGGDMLFMINGVKSTSGLTLDGTTVTVANSALNQTSVTVSGGYELKLANDVTLSTTTPASWNLSGNVATYKALEISAGYSINNNQINYIEASGGEEVQISGVKSVDGLTINGNVVTVSASALTESNVTISDGYTLQIGNDVAAPITAGGTWTLDGNRATFNGGAVTAGYTLVNNQIVYTPTSDGQTITVNGVKATGGLSVNGTVVNVEESALNQENVTISNGYTLSMAAGIAAPSTTAASWNISGNVATYKAEAISAGYTLSNNQISYTPASGGEEVQITGVKSLDGLTISGNVVTVSNSALNDSNVTVSEGYTLQLANDVLAPATTQAGWSLSGTTATYKNAQTTAGYTLSNNQIVYTPAGGGATFNVTGVKSLNGISVSGNTVTVANSALNQDTVTISNGYTLALGNDVLAPTTTTATWTHSGTTATYKNAQTFAGYTLANNQISYTTASGGEEVQITGVKSSNGISINGKVITVSDSALNNSNVTVSEGYTLQLANDVAAPTTTAATWTHSGTTATYKAAQTFAGYSLVNNQIVYTPASGGATFNVNGVKSKDGLSLSGDTVTVGNAALNQGTVTINDSTYKLQLASDVAAPKTTPAAWTISGTSATYRNASTTAGYTLANNQISYTPMSSGGTIAVNGVKNTDGLSLNGNVVTVSNSALNGSRVTISDGYKLELGNDVTKTATISAGWTYDRASATATYINEAISAGYKLENDQLINYVKASGGDEVSISGVKSSDGITIENDIVTVGNAALNKRAVKVSDGYNLKLGEDVPKPVATKAGWTLNDNIATYRTAATTEGYTLADNQASYTAAISGNTLVEVTGVKDANGLQLNDDNTVTVYNAALNGTEMTISDGYEFELADDVAKSINKTGWLKLDNDNLAYQIGATTAGYKVEGGKIIYVGTAVEGEKVAEMSGLDSTAPPSLDENGITLAADNFEDNVEVISSEIRKYELPSEDYENKTFTGTGKIDKITNVGAHISINGNAGNDRINNSGSEVTLEGGTGDDNVTISGGESGNTYVYSEGDGKDILYKFTGNDSIQVLGTATIEESVKNKDVIFKIGKGSITVRDAAATAGMKIALIDSEDKEIMSNMYTSNGIIRNDKIELSATLKKPYAQEAGITEVDGSKVKDGVAITGNETGGTLTGGDGKDTLTSSAGNFELEGGKGNDVFVYGGGNDTIADYSQGGTYGADKISLGSFEETDYEIEGEDVILSYGEGNELTLTKVKGMEITFAGKKTEIKRYTDEGVFENKNKSLRLAEDMNGSLDASKGKDYSKLVTINGSAVSNDLEVKGNSKANYIVAGKSNTTLNGGKGKDTLVGGEGKDTFIYENKSGNKTIQDYNFEDDDVISLGSGAAITQVTTKGKNAVLKVGSNTITIENAAKFNFVENDVEKTYNGGNLEIGDSVTLESNFKSTFDLNDYSTYNNVSAELGKKAVTLKGDEGDNVLTGGKGKDALYGGDNNDTLNGGKGNDTLWGDDGADTFVYYAGEGTDVIKDYNYTDGDLLQIFDKRGREIESKQVKKWTYDGNDLTLTINGGGKIILEGVGRSASVKFSSGNEQKF